MPETTLLIKAALNLRVGAVFDVYGASLGTGSCDKRLYRVSGFLRRKNRSAHAGNLPDCNQAAGTSVGGEYCYAVIDKIVKIEYNNIS